MTVQQAEAILLETDIRIALQHRFAGDRGTILRLDNYAMINIFDDGRYYIQGEDIEALVEVFTRIEEPWDPDTWTGGLPEPVLPWFPKPGPPKRFEF
jgi:hypothetical protein